MKLGRTLLEVWRCAFQSFGRVFMSCPSVQKITKGSDSDNAHPFGGCSRLLNHYQNIGAALLKIESEPITTHTQKEFRVSVAFISLEVLESYLEDLLDPLIADERLCIFREKPKINTIAISLLGLFLAIAIGLYAVSAGASLVLSFALTVCLAFPFALLWHFSPQEGATRRMRFAQILSQEISRRHGGDGKGRASTLSGSRFLEKFLSTSPTGSTQGAAFEIVH